MYSSLFFASRISSKSSHKMELKVFAMSVLRPLHYIYNSRGVLVTYYNNEVWNDANIHNFNDASTMNVKGSTHPFSISTSDQEPIQVHFSAQGFHGDTCTLSGVGSGEDSSHRISFKSDQLIVTDSKHRVVDIRISSTVQPPWGYAGDIQWSLDCELGEAIPAGSSNLEIYQLTTKLPSFFKRAVSIELLRKFLLPSREEPQTDFTQWTIDAAFQRFGYRYDIGGGVSHFNVDGRGGSFDLKKWLAMIDKRGICNCYDQAALAQIVLGLNPGRRAKWLFMSPFGYVSETKLIGIGQRNNLEFSNHAFLGIGDGGDLIADATIGPHLATEDLATYIDVAIDPRQDTFDKNIMCPGGINDVYPCTGVTDISLGSYLSLPRWEPACEGISSTSPSRAMPRMVIESRGIGHSEPKMININIPALDQSIRAEADVLYYDHSISTIHSELQWVLKSDTQNTEIAISVYRNSRDAVDAMDSHLRRYQRPVEQIFTPSPKDFPEHIHELSSQFSQPGSPPYSSRLWVQGNIFTWVAGPFTLDDLDKHFITNIKNQYADSYDEDALRQPKIKNIESPELVWKGDTFIVRVEVEDSDVSAVSSGDNGIIILKEAKSAQKVCEFMAIGIGTENLEFAFAHTTSGVVVSQSVKVESKPSAGLTDKGSNMLRLSVEYIREDRLTQATNILQQVLTFENRGLQPDDRIILIAKYRLGLAFLKQNRLVQAEDILESVLAQREQLLRSRKDVFLSYTMYVLGIVYKEQGNLAKAKDMFQQALDSAKRERFENNELINNIEVSLKKVELLLEKQTTTSSHVLPSPSPTRKPPTKPPVKP